MTTSKPLKVTYKDCGRTFLVSYPTYDEGYTCSGCIGDTGFAVCRLLPDCVAPNGIDIIFLKEIK